MPEELTNYNKRVYLLFFSTEDEEWVREKWNKLTSHSKEDYWLSSVGAIANDVTLQEPILKCINQHYLLKKLRSWLMSVDQC